MGRQSEEFLSGLRGLLGDNEFTAAVGSSEITIFEHFDTEEQRKLGIPEYAYTLSIDGIRKYHRGIEMACVGLHAPEWLWDDVNPHGKFFYDGRLRDARPFEPEPAAYLAHLRERILNL